MLSLDVDITVTPIGIDIIPVRIKKQDIITVIKPPLKDIIYPFGYTVNIILFFVIEFC